jgi:hypothetical protein
MNALDKMLAQTVASVIRKKLGEKTYLSIENRLSERWDMTVVSAIQDFNKIDAILREFFGAGADAIERDILTKIFSLQYSKKGKSLLSIDSPDLSREILETYGNSEKRAILNIAFKKPAPILDILEDCNLPKSTGYRVVGELINDGFLAEVGFSTTSDGKKVTKYTSIFHEIKIDIKLEDIAVYVVLKDEVLTESNLVKVLQGRF